MQFIENVAEKLTRVCLNVVRVEYLKVFIKNLLSIDYSMVIDGLTALRVENFGVKVPTQFHELPECRPVFNDLGV